MKFINAQEIIYLIFYRLLSMSITSSMIGIVILIFVKILKKQIRPKIKYGIWLIFIVSLLLPISINVNNVLFTNSLLAKIREYEKVYISSTDDFNYFLNGVTEWNNSDANFSENVNNFIINIIPIVCFCIFLILILKFIITQILVNFRKEEYTENPRVLSIFNKCKEKLNINKDIKIVVQDNIKSSSICGFKNVRIFLSKDHLDLVDEKFEYVLLHELTHYQRKDNYMNYLLKILSFIYFFNPLILFFLREIKKEMEYATDECVIRKLDGKSIDEYCKLLVKLSAKENSMFSTESYFSYKKLVSRRITLIYNLELKKFLEVMAIISVLIFSILINIRFNELSIFEVEKLVSKLGSFTGSIESASYKYNEDNEFFLVSEYIYDLNLFKEGYSFLLNSVDNNQLFYRYLKTVEYNSRKCGVISIYSKTDNTFYDIDMWIDLENGKVLKEEIYNNTESNLKSDIPNSYTVYEYED